MVLHSVFSSRAIQKLVVCLLLAGLAVVAAGVSATESGATSMQPPLQTALSVSAYDHSQPQLEWALLDGFYATQEGRLLWHVNGQLNRQGRELLDKIASVSTEGLSPNEYHLELIQSFPRVTTGSTLQLREALLTDALFRLVKHLDSGRFDPKQYDSQWYLTAEPMDPVKFLVESVYHGDLSDLTDRLIPHAESYRQLRQALARYRQIENTYGGWPVIQAGYTLRPGMRDVAIEQLRRRLQIETGYPAEPSADLDHYDELLREAVIDFQYRNGLEADGLIGPLTRKALNIPVETRIAQIQANMERWRWLPRDLGDQHLLVNTGGYELTLMVEGKPVSQQRTIIGTRKRQTPSFRSNITHLVLNPEWTVPRTIAVEDLLPRQQKDAGFLEQREIQVFQQIEGEWFELEPQTLDWGLYHEDHFPFILRQKPGVKNSLGRIKFHMSNPYAVFLHDTPVRSLFKQPIRAFSSGCVRVQGADQLARRLLVNGGQSVLEALNLPLEEGETQIVKLAKPMPVYLVYFTSWVDQQGRLHFRPDIYERNRELLQAFKVKQADSPTSYQSVAELF